MLPVFFGSDVRVPKWPGAALPRANLVNLAAASLAVEEHAITVVEFDQGAANPHSADILALELLDRYADFCRQGVDLFLVYPNIAGCPGAAIAAAGPGK